MKKSISIVIALLLLINVFAVSAFAAVPADNAIAITLTSDKTSYAAGETAMVTISIETKSGVPALSAGEIEISYNNAIFAPAADISGQPSLKTYGCTYGEIVTGNLDEGGTFVREGSGVYFPSDEEAYGWNAGLHFALCENFENVTHVDCSTGPKTFITFPIKINAGVADGTYTIGVNKATFEDSGEAYLFAADGVQIYGGEGSKYGVADDAIFACGTLEITVGGAGGSEEEKPTETVKNISAQVQWADKAAGTMNVGFRGEISGFDLASNKGATRNDGNDKYTELKRLEEVGVIFSRAGGDAEKVKSQAIYDFKSGTYFYRVVVGNIPFDSSDALTAQAYIVVGGVEVKADDVISTTGAQEYARATGLATNPMPKK